ncbi:MAG: sugar nucleotide-binding protein, partial [Nanoarchaeota archaeon]
GIYHRTNDGVCTWFDFARKIIEFKKLKVSIKPMTSDKLDRAAKRPRSTVLLNTKLPKLRHWEEALKEFLNGVDKY